MTPEENIKTPEEIAKELRRSLRKADIRSYMDNVGQVRLAISAENLRTSTLANYESYLKIFAAWLILYCNGILFTQVEVDTVRKFSLFLKNQLLLAPNTINGYLAAIRKMFAVVQQKEVTKKILPDLVVDTRMPHVPSMEQVGKLLDACQTLRELLFVAILISTGMRLCELLNLRFRDIQREQKKIYIAESKGRSDGYAALTERVTNILKKYCQEYNKDHPDNMLTSDDYIFYNEKRDGPEKPGNIRCMYYEIKKRAFLDKEPFNIHSLRHFFALNLYLQSHDPILVKRCLRHKTYGATEKYVLLAVSLEMQAKYGNPGDMAFDKSKKHNNPKKRY